MHHQGRLVPPYQSNSSSEDNENQENFWNFDKKFKKKDQKRHLFELFYQFTPRSEFEKSLLLGILPKNNLRESRKKVKKGLDDDFQATLRAREVQDVDLFF